MVRFKNRYVLGRIEWLDREHMDLSGKSGEKGIGSTDIFRALRSVVEKVFGQFGFATIQSSLQVKYWNEKTGSCILRVARDQSMALISSLAHVREIKHTPCTWHTLHISGTIRKCQRTLYLQNKETLILRDMEDDDEQVITNDDGMTD